MPRVEKSLDYLSRQVSHTKILQEFSACLNAYALSPHQSFGVDYLRSEFLSKYSTEKDGASQRRSRAIEKWLGVEEANALTNVSLYGISFEELRDGVTFDDILDKAASFTRQILGKAPSPETLFGSFSGGASTSKRRDPGVLARKYVEKPDVTHDAWPYVLPILLGSAYGWVSRNEVVLSPNFVSGNILFTVPKNAMIDRVACKEPDLNMFAQKAYGNYIRMRLRAVGIDLNDQSQNRDLAAEGARTGRYATLDLSSASDTLSTSIVARLLPPDWFDVLSNLRCKRTNIDGSWHENEMFSSMGNGFTFELETLVFYTIARAVAYYTGTSGRIVVYGDDIVCPSTLAPDLMWALELSGFLVNAKKSYWYGAFRESCGGHYLDELDVTPFYVRDDIKSLPDLILFLNSVRSWACRLGLNFGPLYAFWRKWSKLVPRKVWGGTDCSNKYRLCSPHKGCFALTYRKKAHKALSSILEDGFYESWLNMPSVADSPLGESGIRVRIQTETHELRVNRIEWHRTWEPLFLKQEEWWCEELLGDSTVTVKRT